jgi:heptosyltransferase-2
MELAVTDGQRDEARRLLQDVSRPFALLCPGANKTAKRWPAERFAAAAEKLATRHGLSIVATGAPSESSIVAAVSAASGTPVVDLAARGVTLGGLKGVIAETRIMITNDTGPRHIAAALGVPVVTLFGPTDHRWTTIDFPDERILVAEPFLPQELTADDHQAACAIERITVGDVLSAAERLLADHRDRAPAARDASPAPTPPDPAGTR